MKILGIKIPDGMATHTLLETDWTVEVGCEIDTSWVGGRVSQINPVMLKMLTLKTKSELQESDRFFVEYIKGLMTEWSDVLLVARCQRLDIAKLNLLGSFRALYIIRCRLEDVDQLPRRATDQKRIYQLDRETEEIINVWDGVNAASRGTGTPQGSISNAAHGRHETAGGFKWSFLPPGDRPKREKTTLALHKTLKDMMYNIFCGCFHPDEWDPKITEMNEALNETLPPDYLETLEYALRLAGHDAYVAKMTAIHHEEGEVAIGRKTEEYEHIISVFHRITGKPYLTK